LLYPESLENWVNQSNPVRVIDSFVGALDLVHIHARYFVAGESYRLHRIVSEGCVGRGGAIPGTS
jgi:hypothetical protein